MNKLTQPASLLGPVPILWLLLVVALAIAPLGRYLPVWFWPLAISVLGWRMYLLHRPVPRWHVLTATVVTLAAIGASVAHGLGRETGITILSSMAVLKLLEARTRRDAWIVIVLGFFLIMTRFLYSQELMLLPWPLLGLLVMTYTVLLLESSTQTTLKTAGWPAIRKHWFNPQLFRQAGRYLILAMPLAVVFFLLFPRLSAPIWGSPENFSSGKTGLSGSMSPGSIAELFMDDSPAMRVVFDTQHPPRAHMYWRGPVLERFDGHTWHASDTVYSHQTPPTAPNAPILSYAVELEPHGQHFLPALDFPLAAPKDAILAADLHLHRKRPVNQLLHYPARSILVNPLPASLTSWRKKQLLSLPPGSNPKTRRLINRWRQETPEPQALIQRILAWFNERSFYYTFTPPPLLQPHTIDAFLFDTRAGFCEHYASAFTFMMRAAGIPARVVTGYQGGLDNGDYWLVRQSDAHAWSEVWLEGQGWLRVDPTAAVAPDRVSSGGRTWLNQARHWYDTEWLNRLRLGIDQWRYQWNRWVRNYNRKQQESILRSLGLEKISPAQISLIMGLAVLLGGLLGLVGLRNTRRIHPPPLPAERLFRSVEQKMKRLGMPRQSAEGPVDYLHRGADCWPALGEDLRNFAQLYARCRYAPDSRGLTADHPDVQRLRHMANALIKRLDASPEAAKNKKPTCRDNQQVG